MDSHLDLRDANALVRPAIMDGSHTVCLLLLRFSNPDNIIPLLVVVGVGVKHVMCASTASADKLSFEFSEQTTLITVEGTALLLYNWVERERGRRR